MVDRWYGKFEKLQDSSDDEEVRASIDTSSFLAWQYEGGKQNVKETHETLDLRMEEIKKDMKKDNADVKALQKELNKLELQSEYLDYEAEQMHEANKQSNSTGTESFKKMSHRERRKIEIAEKLDLFIKKCGPVCQKFGLLSKDEESQRFMLKHTELLQEEAVSYLIKWAMLLEMENSEEFVANVARQSICLERILKVAKGASEHPSKCVASFYENLKKYTPEHKRIFESEVERLRDLIRKEAANRKADWEEHMRQERLGPGGLDPAEVFDELPRDIRATCESKDMNLLNKMLNRMPPEKAEYYRKRCEDAGLWKSEVIEKTQTAQLDPQDEQRILLKAAEKILAEGDEAEKGDHACMSLQDETGNYKICLNENAGKCAQGRNPDNVGDFATNDSSSAAPEEG